MTDTSNSPFTSPEEIAAEQHALSIEANLAAAGQPTQDRVQRSYFGTEETFNFMLDDGISFITHKKLNEGARRRYQNDQNKEIAIKKATQDYVMKLAPGDSRHLLLTLAVCNWNLVDDNGRPVPFSKGSPGSTWEQFLQRAEPSLIDDLEAEIREKNPWLSEEMTVEAIDEEIEKLHELRNEAVKREEGKVS